MKSSSLRWAACAAAVVLGVLGLGCGGRVQVGAGGASGGQGGAGAEPSPCDLAIGSPCECGSFPLCPEGSVQGIPCCGIRKMCDGEDTCKVAWTGSVCHDWCDTSCEHALDPDQCVTLGCDLTPNGCATPPP